MYSIIGQRPVGNPVQTWSLVYAKRVLDFRLSQAIKYYRENHVYVNSNHLLYKLIESFGYPINLEERYIGQYILSRAFNHANNYKFTSAQNAGRIHHGNFYGNNASEVILMKDVSHQWNDVKYDWKNLIPVRVLRHDQTHFSYNLLTPKNFTENKSLAIVEIDINLFYMMYVAWLRDQHDKKRAGVIDTINDVGYFLGMYCIPNMLSSHINQVVLNRNEMLTDNSIHKTISYTPEPFQVMRNYNYFEAALNDSFKRQQSGNFSIEEISYNTIGIGNIPALSFLEIHDVYFNRQNEWAYILSLTRWVKHCIETPKVFDKANNSKYLRPFQRELKYLLNANAFNNPMNRIISHFYMDEIMFILNTKC